MGSGASKSGGDTASPSCRPSKGATGDVEATESLDSRQASAPQVTLGDAVPTRPRSGLGVSLHALEQLASQVPEAASTDWVVEHLLRPATNAQKCAYADLPSMKPHVGGPIAAVVCHHSTGSFHALVSAVVESLMSTVELAAAMQLDSDLKLPQRASTDLPVPQRVVDFAGGMPGGGGISSLSEEVIQRSSPPACTRSAAHAQMPHKYVWLDVLCVPQHKLEVTRPASVSSLHVEGLDQPSSSSVSPSADLPQCCATSSMKDVLAKAPITLVVIHESARVFSNVASLYALHTTLQHRGPNALRLAACVEPTAWQPVMDAFRLLNVHSDAPGLLPQQRAFLQGLEASSQLGCVLSAMQRGLLQAANQQYLEAINHIPAYFGDDSAIDGHSTWRKPLCSHHIRVNSNTSLASNSDAPGSGYDPASPAPRSLHDSAGQTEGEQAQGQAEGGLAGVGDGASGAPAQRSRANPKRNDSRSILTASAASTATVAQMQLVLSWPGTLRLQPPGQGSGNGSSTGYLAPDSPLKENTPSTGASIGDMMAGAGPLWRGSSGGLTSPASAPLTSSMAALLATAGSSTGPQPRPPHYAVQACRCALAFLEADGQYGAAEGVARTLYDAVCLRNGPRSLRTAAALINLCRLQCVQGYFHAAEVPAQQALELLELRCASGEHLLLSQALITLGRVKEGLGLADDAEDLYRRAVNLLDQQYGPGSEVSMRPLLRLGRFLAARGRHFEAEVFLQVCLHNIQEFCLGEANMPRRRRNSHLLAFSRSRAQQPGGPESPAGQGPIAASAAGSCPCDLGVGDVSSDIPLCLPVPFMALWTSAATDLARTLAAIELEHDNTNPLYENGAVMCGQDGACDNYETQRLRGARALSEQALAARRAAFGRHHVQALTQQRHHATLLSQLGCHGEAAAEARGAVEGLVDQLGPHHPQVLEAQLDLASILMAGAAADAASRGAAAAPAGPIARTAGGGSASSTSASGGGYAAAESVLLAAQSALQGSSLADADRRRCRLHELLSTCLAHQRRLPEAIRHRLASTALLEPALGSHHAEVMLGFVSVGVLHEASNQLKEAEAAFARAAEISTHRNGALNQTTKKVYRNLLSVYRKQGRAVECDLLIQMHKLVRDKPVLLEVTDVCGPDPSTAV